MGKYGVDLVMIIIKAFFYYPSLRSPFASIGRIGNHHIDDAFGLRRHIDAELFVSKDGDGKDTLLANEIAPRVHNSGHFSIEGAVTSQFENHIRAVVGLPLGDTDNVHPSIMVNVLGEYPDLAEVLSIDGVHYHTYHKEERENRKIAHLTLMPNDVANLEATLHNVVAVLPNKMGLDA